MLNLTLILLVINWFVSSVTPAAAVVATPAAHLEPASRKEIPWSEGRRLTWGDFVGEPDSRAPLHALASTNIDMKARCVKGTFKFEVKSVFLMEESWSKNKISDPLLFHEQLHFDLTEIYARRIRKELQELTDACGADHTMINSIVNRIFDEWKQEQDLYDEESHHGLNKVAQQKWADLISLRLSQTVAYQQVNVASSETDH